MHDVDLLPTHPGFAQLYSTPHAGPVPIAKTWSRYEYPNYIGGITGFGVPLFRKINGYPNNFWGWGGEDDDLRRRLEAVGYPPTEWVQPPAELKGKIRDLEEEFIAKCGGKRAGVGIKHGGRSETLNLVRQERLRETYRTWWQNGLNSLAFDTVGVRALNEHVTVVTVDLLAARDKDSVKLTDLPEWARR
jgi:beta-1,4-galactosyltransferase 4